MQDTEPRILTSVNIVSGFVPWIKHQKKQPGAPADEATRSGYDHEAGVRVDIGDLTVVLMATK